MHFCFMKYKELNDRGWMADRVEVQNMSLREIAKEVGCSYGGVIFSVRKFGIKVPEKKGGPKVGTDMSRIAKAAYRRKYGEGRFGELAANWKGGIRRLGKNRSYIGIFSPHHPDATNDGYILEHRLVMEKKIGRRLNRGEIVHHINGIKHDNRPENLGLMSGHGEHARKHFDAVKEVDRLRKLLLDHGINPDA